MSNQIKVFVGPRFGQQPYLDMLEPFWGEQEHQSNRWTDSAQALLRSRKFFDVVQDIQSADYILLPHYYNSVLADVDYLKRYNDLTDKSGKRLIVILLGDSSDYVPLKNSIIFRNSQYRHRLTKGEVIMPAFVEDLSKINPTNQRSKGLLPTVGFCGWADYKSSKEAFRAMIKKSLNFLSFKDGFLNQGLHFRRKALKKLATSKLVKADFIIRKSYSANEKTISLDPIVARKEYISNIVNNDFSLAIKGDGNFSLRFFEILSLGRIPVLIDTDCPLPLSNFIDYNSFILRIDYRQIGKAPKLISKFYQNISEEEFKQRQATTKAIFQEYLRIDKFFDFCFKAEFLNNILS